MQCLHTFEVSKRSQRTSLSGKTWRAQKAATHQEGLVELKQAGELLEQLVNTVQPLQEDGTLLAHIGCVLLVTTPVPKLMTIIQPVGLHKHLEPLWTTLI